MKLKKFEEFAQLNEKYKLSKVVKKDEKDGYQILIGRNSISNDILTTQIANDEDIFLHTYGIPGAHIIIKNPDNVEIPMGVVRYAAELAGKNSKGAGKVKVVWTKAKNVSKNNKHNIGQVSVDYNKSKFININI